MRVLLPFVLSSVVLVACGSSSEKTSPIPPGSYVLESGGSRMTVAEDGWFAWSDPVCGDVLYDGKGSFETDPDGSIHVYACETAIGGGGAEWTATREPVTKLRARVTDTGFEVDVQIGRGDAARTETQRWTRGDRCTSACGCREPYLNPGC